MKKRLSTMLLACVLVLSVSTLAKTYSKNITVYPGVNIYVDDAKLNPTDANGNTVEVFIYNGTTYLPVRAVSEALGKVVQWDGATNSVYIGKHTGNKPAVWLTDLDYFTQSFISSIGETTEDNLGIVHQHSINFSSNISNKSSIVYKLNGQYSHLTGMFYQQYSYRSYTDSGSATLKIFGDGELLWQGTVGCGIDPASIDADVSGVLELEIQRFGGGYYPALGDLGLWT